MFYDNYVAMQIQRLRKNLPNRFDDGNNIPANNIQTFGFVFQFAHPCVDGKLGSICVSYAIDNKFQTKTYS